MNWQEQAAQDLRKYEQQKQSIENIPERIRALREKYEAVKCVCADTPAVDGGGGRGRAEDAMLDNILERKRLALTLAANRRVVALVERGLAALSEPERAVLDAFYINPRGEKLEYLRDELGYERSQVYRIKDEALYKYTVNQYGIPEM